MIEVRTYIASFAGGPTEEEIREAIRIATEDNCIVKFSYFLPGLGNRKLYIRSNGTVEHYMSELYEEGMIR